MVGVDKNRHQLAWDKFGCDLCSEENGGECDQPVPVENGLRCSKSGEIMPDAYYDAWEDFRCKGCDFHKVGECGGPEDPPLLDAEEDYYCPAQEILILKEALSSPDWQKINKGVVLKNFLHRAMQRARVLKRCRAQYGNPADTMYVPADRPEETSPDWAFKWGKK